MRLRRRGVRRRYGTAPRRHGDRLDGSHPLLSKRARVVTGDQAVTRRSAETRKNGSDSRSARSLPSMHRLTKAQARRIAVRAQLLDAPRPTELLRVVQQLTLLQIDPTAAIAPSADLVAWSRLGPTYRPAHLQQALEQDRTLFEHNALVRPMSDLGLYLADAADWPSREGTRAWMRDNDSFRRDILDLLGTSGPMSSRDIPDTCVVPW